MARPNAPVEALTKQERSKKKGPTAKNQQRKNDPSNKGRTKEKRAVFAEDLRRMERPYLRRCSGGELPVFATV